MKIEAASERYSPGFFGRSGAIDFLNAGAIEPNDRILLDFQIILLDILIPQADAAIVAGGIYHQSDGGGLLQALRISTRFSVAEAQPAVHDIAERIIDPGGDLTLVGVEGEALQLGESRKRRDQKGKEQEKKAIAQAPHELF
jgi:hypothetical protein